MSDRAPRAEYSFLSRLRPVTIRYDPLWHKNKADTDMVPVSVHASSIKEAQMIAQELVVEDHTKYYLDLHLVGVFTTR